jgi:hypothetical protein
MLRHYPEIRMEAQNKTMDTSVTTIDFWLVFDPDAS